MKKQILLFAIFPLYFLVSCSGGSSNSSLHYFILDERSLMESNYEMDFKNAMLYNEFELAKLNDEKKAGPGYAHAMMTKKMSKDLCDYISLLKIEIKSEAMNIDKKTADTLRSEMLTDPGNVNIASNYLLNSSNGKAKDLKQKLIDYHESILKLLDSKELGYLQSELSRFKCEECYDPAKQKMVAWEDYNFENIPLVACLARLEAIENQVKIAEGNVTMNLLKDAR
jgi:hypothetical protein